MTAVFTESGSPEPTCSGSTDSNGPCGSLGYHHEGTSSRSPSLELETGVCPMVRLAPQTGQRVRFPEWRSSALNTRPQPQTTRIIGPVSSMLPSAPTAPGTIPQSTTQVIQGDLRRSAG